jgi:hypothetical protein
MNEARKERPHLLRAVTVWMGFAKQSQKPTLYFTINAKKLQAQDTKGALKMMTRRELNRAFRDYPVAMARVKETRNLFPPLKVYPYHETRRKPNWETIILLAFLAGALVLALIG